MEGRLIVQLPHSPDHVAKIKTVAGRRWHAKERHWTVPQGDETLGGPDRGRWFSLLEVVFIGDPVLICNHRWVEARGHRPLACWPIGAAAAHPYAGLLARPSIRMALTVPSAHTCASSPVAHPPRRYAVNAEK